jgi:Ca-activated chloride channel homolog
MASDAERPNRLRTDANLVLIHATVVDRRDHFLMNIRPENFRVFDRSTERRVSSFSLEEAPASIVVVLDTSGSMAGSLSLARQALKVFLDSADPRDEVSIITVGTQPKVIQDFSTDYGTVLDELMQARTSGYTALLDSIVLAVNHMRAAHYSRRAILVISDGAENSSRYTERELVDRLRESDATVYSIGVGLPPAPPRVSDVPQDSESRGDLLLMTIAEETGGRYFEAESPKDLVAIMRNVDFRYAYVLGYVPDASQMDGKYHRVRLKLIGLERKIGARAFARPGYYAPAH